MNTFIPQATRNYSWMLTKKVKEEIQKNKLNAFVKDKA